MQTGHSLGLFDPVEMQQILQPLLSPLHLVEQFPAYTWHSASDYLRSKLCIQATLQTLGPPQHFRRTCRSTNRIDWWWTMPMLTLHASLHTHRIVLSTDFLVPFSKKGGQMCKDIHRHITICSVLSKINSAVREKHLSYWEEDQNLCRLPTAECSPTQCGLRAGLGTCTLIILREPSG